MLINLKLTKLYFIGLSSAQALLIQAPGGQRATNVYFFLQHRKQNGANSNGGIAYRVNSEFFTEYIPNRGGGNKGGNTGIRVMDSLQFVAIIRAVIMCFFQLKMYQNRFRGSLRCFLRHPNQRGGEPSPSFLPFISRGPRQPDGAEGPQGC